MYNLLNRTCNLLTTSSTKYYTAPADGTATVCLIQASYKNLFELDKSNEVTIMVSSSDGLFYLSKNMVIGPRSAITSLSGELILSGSDQIWAYVSSSYSGHSVELVMSMIERNNSGNFSKQYSFLNGSALLSSAYNTLYTVPSDKRAIITFLQLSNITGVSQSIDIRISPAGTGPPYYSLAYGIDIPPSSSLNVLTGKLVLLENDVILGVCENTDTVQAVISGILFTTA